MSDLLRSVTARIPSRVGLVGNPSDGYGGAVLAVPVPRLAATVSATTDSSRTGLALGGNSGWPDWRAFVETLSSGGVPAEEMLCGAASSVAVGELDRRGVVTPHAVDVSWITDIPRSVGLAGSSALAVGVVRAIGALNEVSFEPAVEASLALRVETEVLGLTAGWQDRVVQAFGQPVLVDCATFADVDGERVPTVTTLPPLPGLKLVVGWVSGLAEVSDVYHRAARSRSTDSDVADAMSILGDSARKAAAAWADGDLDTVEAMIDLTWRTRQSVMPLRSTHTALVEAVRALGVVATTPGSGGSVVALCRVEADAEAVEAELVRIGARSVRV